jgi:hypothetical protein
MGDDVEEESDNERVAFLQRHQEHPLAVLKRKKDRCATDRPIWDPLRTSYEEVMDGHETFLLKSWRTDIVAPRQYALLRGAVEVTTTITLHEEPLRDTLLKSFAFSPEETAALVRACQRTVATFSPEELIPAYDSTEDPQISFAYLNEQHLRLLVRRCSETSPLTDKKRMWDFLIRNQQEEELTLELRQDSRLHFL